MNQSLPIFLPNINYAISVYAASESDLTPVQCFLDRCFKRKYTSKPVRVYDFLERQDRKIFRKVYNAKGRPLLSIFRPHKCHFTVVEKFAFFQRG